MGINPHTIHIQATDLAHVIVHEMVADDHGQDGEREERAAAAKNRAQYESNRGDHPANDGEEQPGSEAGEKRPGVDDSGEDEAQPARDERLEDAVDDELEQNQRRLLHGALRRVRKDICTQRQMTDSR